MQSFFEYSFGFLGACARESRVPSLFADVFSDTLICGFFLHSKRGGGGPSLLFIGMVFSFGDRDHSNEIFVRNA